nr:oligosaccharide flippase family protein [Stutzerimonas azotifigens]
MVRNTGLSYLGQAYALLVGIVVLPFYLGHLGAEAYGLIGFFAVMQAWLQVLDAGLSPSLVRQVASHRGGGGTDGLPGRLLRSFELIFLPIAVATVAGIGLGSGWIADHWLQAQQLDVQVIARCIALMGLMVGLRLYITLYKSGIQGMERHAWLNGANVAIASLRYLGGLWLVARVTQEPLHFFLFQTAVTLVEAALFAVQAYRLLPAPHRLTGFDWRVVRPVLPFAAGLSLTTLLSIVLTQLDKVLLSNLLLLREYGYFSLVALIATGLTTLANPLVQTLLPRLTLLTAEGRVADMQALYLNANRFICSILFPLAGVIAFHARDLLFAWSGDAQAAQWSAAILPWYAAGSALLAVGAFQFYLQYAYGRLRMHIWYSLVSTAISIPVVAYAAFSAGALGAALAWFFLRLATLAIWPTIVHRRFAPELQGPWMRDLLRVAAATALGLLLGEPLFDAIASEARLDILLALAASGLLCLLLVTASTRGVRERLYLMALGPSTRKWI